MRRTQRSEQIVTAAVPRDVARAIRQLARHDDRTTSAYIRRVLATHVRQLTGGEDAAR